MHRFFSPPRQAQGPAVTLVDGEAHHALHVLRVREGERVVVLDGAGHELLCEVDSIGRSSVDLRVLQRQSIPPLPCRITLAQSIIKGKSMELVVQKATELGVHRILPILSERSVSQIGADEAPSKMEKWRATCIEAVKQCGSPWLPEIDPPQTPAKFLSTSESFDLVLMASLQPEARHPREYFHSLAGGRRAPRSVCVWVGPEGDFTPAEVNAIRQAGAFPITLGRLILRSETAAIYCLSILSYEFQSPAVAATE